MHHPAETQPGAAQEPMTPDGWREAVSGRGIRLRPWHVAGVVLLVAVGGLLLYGFWPVLVGEAGEESRPEAGEAEVGIAQVEAVAVEAIDFPLRAEATGYLAPWRRAVVSPELSGRVVARPVEEGRRVAAGALLFELDDREHQIERGEAEAELLQTRAEYGVAIRQDGELQLADTSFLSRQRQAWEEAEAAYQSGSLSEEALRAERRRLEAAEVLSGDRRADVQAVVAGLSQAEQRMARAELALDRTRITAPFAGRIADLEVEEGQQVASGEEAVVLLDDTRMKVEVDVLERDLVRIEEGASARVRLPAMDNRRFEGTVHAINPRVEAGRGTGRVTVAIPNPEGRLVSGLYAYVEVESERLEGRLVVPTDAVLVRQGRDLVFRIADGRAEWVYVETGARSGDYVEIVEGLEAGDVVATGGHHELAHDARVEVAELREVVAP